MKKPARLKLILFFTVSVWFLLSGHKIIKNIEIYNGSKVSFAASDTFNSSGTWVAPEGIYSVSVACWGGGGGGGGSTRRTAYSGGGGGGGGYAISTDISVTPASEYQVVVGNAGTAGAVGASGGTGGTSSFNGSDVIATGGSGGGAGGATAGTAGSGGTGSTGDTTYTGGSGAIGTLTVGGGGGEGSGSTSNGGNASGQTGGTGTNGGDGGNGGNSGAIGNPGSVPGGAGGGAGKGSNKAGFTGGAGASGRCVVTYTDTWAPSTSQTTYSPTWSFSSNPSNTSTSQIDMVATTGYDYTTPIEYLFTLDTGSCPSGHAGTGGTSSSWQTSTSYSDTGLDTNKCYGYKVQARDSSSPSNSGPNSSLSYLYTSANTPGTPSLNNPTLYTLDIDNNSNGNPSSDPDTKYAVQVTYANPSDASWQDKWVSANGYRSDYEVWLTDSELDSVTIQDLQQGTEYGLAVKARNEDGDETSLSGEGRGTTSQMQTSATFNTSGTWTAPDGVNAIDIECWGGGGGGGGSTANTPHGGGGGGGGAYSKSTNISVVPSTEYQVIIGQGGSGGTEGIDGDPGESSFFETDTVVALGGGGGTSGGGTPGTAGSGGNSEDGVGDVLFSGGNGANGVNPTGGGGGEGSGNTSNGGNATGQTGGTGTDGGDGGNGGNSNTNGSVGTSPGGAGGGAGNGDSSTGYNGGDGADGMCHITYKERVEGTLSCNVTTSCPYGVVVYKMTDLTNAHAELPTQSNYNQMVCCTGVPGLSNQCSGNYETVLKLSSQTNAHVEKNTQNNYPESVCLHVPENGIVEIGYKADSCSGYDTVLGSISSITNAHIGDENAYPTKICATALVSGTISFNISDNVLGLGTLNTDNSRFATSDEYGSEDEVPAHTISASTNGFGGYTIYIQGPTLANLNNSEDTIAAIGSTGSPPLAGTEQFGIRATASGGNGVPISPYDDTVFYAYGADEITPDDIASDPDNDDISTEYSIYYLANISGGTPQGEYSTNITFIIVSNF